MVKYIPVKNEKHLAIFPKPTNYGDSKVISETLKVKKIFIFEIPSQVARQNPSEKLCKEPQEGKRSLRN